MAPEAVRVPVPGSAEPVSAPEPAMEPEQAPGLGASEEGVGPASAPVPAAIRAGALAEFAVMRRGLGRLAVLARPGGSDHEPSSRRALKFRQRERGPPEPQ